MPATKVPARFLLRASVALVMLSAVWWFLLIDPLLFGLQQCTEFLGEIVFGQSSCALVAATASGNWNICVPVTISASTPSGPSRVSSVEFEMARSGPIAFTFGLPVYWAILLAGPRDHRWLRLWTLGTGVTAVLEALLFLMFVRTYAYAVLAQPVAVHDPVTKWFFDSCQYLELNVGPAVTPIFVALYLHRSRLWQVLAVAGPDGSPPNRVRSGR